jgi:PAS domain S-box-containing protein
LISVDITSEHFYLADRAVHISAIRDITEKKQTEDALQKSEERLKLALDSVSDAVWDWQVDTGEVYFSSRWYTMLGYKPYELPQAFETWRKLLHPDDLSESEAKIFRHLESAEPFVIEFRMRTKDNHWRWILARGKAVEQDNQGKAVRMLGRPHPCDNCAASKAYISKELETVEKYIPEMGRHFLCTSNPILDNNKNIKLIIQQLTDITEKKKIDEQISQLQKAESLSRMAGAIAHHFNNQLSVVMGNLELVLDDLPDDAENRENLFQSFEAGRKAAEVSQQMLRYLGHISGSQTTIDLSKDTIGMVAMIFSPKIS